jgi:colanic acid/amylovoran biosynthesis glycosyltransferase
MHHGSINTDAAQSSRVRPTVLVYRDRLLPASETFVRAQASMLRQFDATYVGSRAVAGGLALSNGRLLVSSQPGFRGLPARLAFKLWGVAPRLYRTARALRPALIHAHFGTDGALALPLARALDVPLVVTFHGYDATIQDRHVPWSHLTHQLFLRRRKTLQREAALFIAVSGFVRQRLLDQGFPGDKTVVHYIGIDTEFFQPDGNVAREPVVLFVGRLVEKKGCEHLLHAMRRVQETHPQANVVVIGDGPLRPRLEELAARVVPRCTFLGSRPPEAVRDWMNRARVFCTPSVTARSGDAEGFGLVFAEAQAMGLPVVSFRSGGVPEAVEDGRTGFLVAEKDDLALADSIARLLSDRSTWERFSVAGQARVRTLFDLRAQTAQLEKLYMQALSARLPA